MMPPKDELARRRILGFTANVFFLGLASLLTDISSEMTLTLLPLFLANVLGVVPAVIGLIEGVAESTASLLKVGSGYLSDRVGRRKGLTVVGYGLSALSKPMLYFATNWGLVLAVRFTDRVGKGVRTSPRDALLAASAPLGEVGGSFGFHRGMDTAGAVAGLGLATLVVYLTQQGSLELVRETYQVLVLLGVVPGLLALALVQLQVREVDITSRFRNGLSGLEAGSARPTSTDSGSGVGLGRRLGLFLLVMALFTLGNSSDAFLLLRAQILGLSVLEISIVLVLFNVIYSLVALPAGALSDRFGRRRVIIVGWAAYALIYLGFALAGAGWQVGLLFILYGFYYGAVEGVARAFVADLAPQARLGTAYGLFHATVGLAALPASLVAGGLWQLFGPAAPFYFGASLAALAMVGLLALVR